MSVNSHGQLELDLSKCNAAMIIHLDISTAIERRRKVNKILHYFIKEHFWLQLSFRLYWVNKDHQVLSPMVFKIQMIF